MFGQLGSTLSRAVSADTFVLTAAPTGNCASTGGSYVMLLTTGVGVGDVSVRSRVGSTACVAATWVSESTVMCKTAGGVRSGLPVVGTLGIRSTTTLSHSYDLGMVGGTRAVVSPTTGSSSITVSSGNCPCHPLSR